MTATQLIHSAPDHSEEATDEDSSQTGHPDETGPGNDDMLPRTDLGTTVHRILEFDKQRSEWSTLTHQIAAVNEFEVTDYKTNGLEKHTTDHYRPQTMSYALALLKHDPDRDIIVNLRFTEGSTTKSL